MRNDQDTSTRTSNRGSSGQRSNRSNTNNELGFYIARVDVELSRLKEAFYESLGITFNSTDDFSGGRSNRGRQNFATSDEDRRTVEGRETLDDDAYDQDFEGMSVDDLFNSAPTNDDGSIDLRTKIGRYMKAEGYVDDDGFEIESQGGNRGRNQNRGRSRASSGGNRSR